MTRAEAKQTIKEAGLYSWQVRDKIGVSEGTFCRWLRYDLDGEKVKIIEKAIEELKADKIKMPVL